MEGFQPPTIEIASNKFTNIPVILKYNEINLIEVISEKEGFQQVYNISVLIYQPNGIYLGKVIGSRIFMTAEGLKSGLILESYDKKSICKLGNEKLFEINYIGSIVTIDVELWTPDGYMIKTSNLHHDKIKLFDVNFTRVKTEEIPKTHSNFRWGNVGIHLKSDGSIKLNN